MCRFFSVSRFPLSPHIVAKVVLPSAARTLRLKFHTAPLQDFQKNIKIDIHCYSLHSIFPFFVSLLHFLCGVKKAAWLNVWRKDKKGYIVVDGKIATLHCYAYVLVYLHSLTTFHSVRPYTNSKASLSQSKKWKELKKTWEGTDTKKCLRCVHSCIFVTYVFQSLVGYYYYKWQLFFWKGKKTKLRYMTAGTHLTLYSKKPG